MGVIFMKIYSEDKQKEIWNKDKAKGKKKYVVYTALLFEGCMLSVFGGSIIFMEIIFKMSFITPLQFIAYAIVLGVVGIIMGIKLWNKRALVFDEIGVMIENTDVELKSLILKGEKIQAIHRYKRVTGFGFIEANKYYNQFSEQYFK